MELVAADTMRLLRFEFIRASLHLYLALPAPRPTAADPFTMDLAGEASGALLKLAEQIEGMRDSDLGDGDTLVEKLRPHLSVARDSVMPRLLAMDKRELIERLSSVEDGFQNLEYNAWLTARFGSDGRLLTGASAQLLRAMAPIYESPEA